MRLLKLIGIGLLPAALSVGAFGAYLVGAASCETETGPAPNCPPDSTFHIFWILMLGGAVGTFACALLVLHEACRVVARWHRRRTAS